jgi:hypothetical protein
MADPRKMITTTSRIPISHRMRRTIPCFSGAEFPLSTMVYKTKKAASSRLLSAFSIK